MKTVVQEKENMIDYGHADCSNMRNERQLFDTIMDPENKVTIHSHMRNSKKNYSQGKQDVKTQGIHSTS